MYQKLTAILDLRLFYCDYDTLKGNKSWGRPRGGKDMGHREIYRAADYIVGFMLHTRIERVVADEDVDAVVERLR